MLLCNIEQHLQSYKEGTAHVKQLLSWQMISSPTVRKSPVKEELEEFCHFMPVINGNQKIEIQRMFSVNGRRS